MLLGQKLHFFMRANNRYSKIDKYLARNFEYNGACLFNLPPFLCSQIMTPFISLNDLHQSGNRVVI